jgi:O-antigen ligase
MGLSRSLAVLRGTAFCLVLLLPWFLLHARAAAEIGIDVAAAAFLLNCGVARDWRWLRRGWAPIALAWWGWLVLCTVWAVGANGQPWPALLQAVAVVRFLVFVAALERWVLADAASRRWFFRSLGLATLYVAVETLLQFATGQNSFGQPRSGDGELTGPFEKPRDAPTFVRMLFPALLPASAVLLASRRPTLRLAGGALIVAAMIVLVLIGQRMPVMLGVLGLLVAALLIRRLRRPVILAVAVGAGLIAASAVVAPPTFYRLVTKFSQQMENFGTSPYGLIAERAVAITEQHPWLGRGYDGYRTGCPEPRYWQDWHWPGDSAAVDATGATLCLTHPHNFYLQAASDAGLPGLALFCWLAVAWLRQIARGGRFASNPLRIGLFVAALIQLWPLASTSPLVSLPIGGWFFLLLGAGLAEAAPSADPAPARAPQPEAARPG